MRNNKSIDHLINVTLAKCDEWVRPEDNGLLQFVDPIEEKEVSAHYGASHAATAFIILGELRGNDELIEKGKSLLSSIIKRWDESKKLDSFHNDFNNFALCTAHDFLDKRDTALKEDIRSKVCSTSDSNHDTINWLPMRWYVNSKRYEWTNSEKYNQSINRIKNVIANATNEDGGIEDGLPKGYSFNLQYDIATVGVLQFINCRNKSVDIDLSKELGFLLNAVVPDGDINYQGRGTNQIFAWGLWIYMLASSDKPEDLDEALSFVLKNAATMLDNNNLMLNNQEGSEQYLWWDYHYSSVYIAHFLFWLVLSEVDNKKNPVSPTNSSTNETGLTVGRGAYSYTSIFNGRSEYLAETGPLISAIWLKEHGTISKGTFGPWQGMFGNNYTFEDVVLRNFIGLVEMKTSRDWSSNRFIRKLKIQLKGKPLSSVSPVMTMVKIVEEDSGITIMLDNIKRKRVALNFPVLETITGNLSLSLFADGNSMKLHHNLKIKNQYGWCSVFQSKTSSAQKWVLKIK